jgi:hypothetical protein
MYLKLITTKINKVGSITAVNCGGRTEDGLFYHYKDLGCYWKRRDKNGHTNFTIAEIDYFSHQD